jgi:serine/threonine-protein kinase HipA
MCQALGIPPALKYESDGGAGVEQIMKLLLGSISSLEDRRTFMTQVFLFWVMGAIDGHAKNFSISLRPGGAFQLTPAYDVISAYPLVAKGQIERKTMAMAMSLKGKRRHYLWEHIFHRHWLATAKQCNFPEDEMVQVIERILGEMDQVVDKVSNALPAGFPEDMAAAIFAGMKRARERV